MRFMVVLGAAAGLLAGAASAVPLVGDANQSGRVDAIDVQLVINGILGRGEKAGLDFTGDGVVDATDLQLVINAVLGIPVDRDGDGLADVAEPRFNTVPTVPDTDGDGVLDGQEVIDGTDPIIAGRGARVPLGTFRIAAPTVLDGPVAEALAHFQDRVTALGGSALIRDDAGTPRRAIHIAVPGDDPVLDAYYTSDRTDPHFAGLEPFQKDEGHFLSLSMESGRTRLYVTGGSTRGTVYALSELERRLRVGTGGVYLDFPEYEPDDAAPDLFDAPALEVRGEYINVGYNIPEITPHEWPASRWEDYIDKLVLAKLNRVYFYVWVSDFSMYPGSALSQTSVSQSVHEGIQGMIDYAHRRGLEVTYMYSPTFFPRDVWDANPAYHAEIEYVDHGFPVACPSAPGSWDLMEELARAEFEWFKEADAIQIWFYDPGGCWCDRFGPTGCLQDQAAILARQLKEFSDLFREYNPDAAVEYNLWPIWLWESLKGFSYRQDMNTAIQQLFGDEYTEVTAVGAPDNNTTRPLMERNMGFRTQIFIFASNPETGYVFPTPHLRWMPGTAAATRSRNLGGAFGHRLEAWSRYAGTFLLAEFLWDPALPTATAVRRFADWQTADPVNGALFAEVITLLDRITDQGATAADAIDMDTRMQQVYQAAPQAVRADLEYYPATTAAIRAIAESIGLPDGPALNARANEFQQALAQSPTYSALVPNARVFFDRYRGFLATGFAAAIF